MTVNGLTVNGIYSGSLPGSTTDWNKNKDVTITLYKKTTDNSYIIYIKENGEVIQELSGVSLEKRKGEGKLKIN